LKTKLRTERGLIYKIDSKISAFKNNGYLTIVFSTNKKNLLPAINVLHQEFYYLGTNKISSADLDRAKGYYNGQALIHSDSLSFLVYWYGKQHILYPDFTQSIEERQKSIQAISAQELQDFSKKYLSEKNWSCFVEGNFLENEMNSFKQELSFG
jgi:predicted Zn-dependent peptidase